MHTVNLICILNYFDLNFVSTSSFTILCFYVSVYIYQRNVKYDSFYFLNYSWYCHPGFYTWVVICPNIYNILLIFTIMWWMP